MRLERFKIKWREFTSVVSTEFRHIFRDGGVMLILIFAMLIYATIYSLAYHNEVLRDIPIAVIDNSRTSTSRQMTEALNAAQNIYVAYHAADMDEARELFFGRKVYAIVYIPSDLETNLLGGEQVKVGVYVDASYFLMYRQAFSDITAVVVGSGVMANYQKLVASGVNAPQAQAVSRPVEFVERSLYNPYLGYGTFLMPAIIIVIIQQTLLIGIGMIGGTWREFGLYKRLRTPGEKRLSTVPIVLGKALVYISIYGVTLSYIFGIHYKLFHYPMHASFIETVSFLLPYLLACIFMGIAVSTLFRYRENSVIFLLWSSIPIVLVSGASLPREALPQWLYIIGKVFPSSSGVEGFLRLETMGASLADISHELITIWILVGVYFVLACLGIRKVLVKAECDEIPEECIGDTGRACTPQDTPSDGMLNTGADGRQ